MKQSKKNDNAVINDTIKPTLNESTNSELECYMKCLNNRDKCCLLQTKEEVGKTSCTLYDIKFHEALLLVQHSTDQNKIVSVVGCAPKDCQTWYKSGYKKDGVYDIEVNGNRTNVFCDMTTDGGGWTVVQRRIARKFITMKGFSIADESNKYKLNVGVFDSGNGSVVASWVFRDGAYFTTKDDDNDGYKDNCAVIYSVGLWYKGCFGINPNGKYSVREDVPYASAIHWNAWMGTRKSLKSIKMQIK